MIQLPRQHDEKKLPKKTMTLNIRHYPLTDYTPLWQAMRQFTDARTHETTDEIWFVEHFPVYTQGQSGKPEHVLNPGAIPIVQADRGGQVTYHGPGQLVAYVLIDLQRLGLNVRSFVTLLEQSIIRLLDDYGVEAKSRCEAPGVYVGDAKICSLGLRVRRGRCYHGLALNVDMDLTPFEGINPCGYANMPVTQMRAYTKQLEFDQVKRALESYLVGAINS
jgi:lipoyl(octanoyl) transferase